MPKRGYSGSYVPFKKRRFVLKAPKPTRYKQNYRTGGFTGIELKFIDYTYNAGIVAANAGAEANPSGIGCINATATGDGESNRDGRRNVIKSIHLRGDVGMDAIDDATALNVARIIRVVVYHDKQSNGVEPNSEDIMLAATNVEHAFRNLQFTKRFSILHDQTFVLNLQAAAAGTATTVDSAGMNQSFTVNKRVNIGVDHDGATAVVGSITDSAIGVIAFANFTGATLAYQSRVRFVG